MHIPTIYWTAFVAAVLSTAALKFLYVFHFVSWSPIGWIRHIDMFSKWSGLVKWGILLIILTAFFLLLYVIFMLTAGLPPSAISLIAALLIVCATEWAVHTPDSLKEAVTSVSIPFLSLAAIIIRFVSGTAIFMSEETENESK